MSDRLHDSDLPYWLHDSDLAAQTREAGLELGPELFREGLIVGSPHISSFSDFQKVIICVDYWGVHPWPVELYRFIISHISEVKNWRDESGIGIVQHGDLKDVMLDLLLDKNLFLEKACEVGSLGWLVYVHSNEEGYEWNGRTCSRAAAKGGHLECLQFAHANGCPWDEYTCACAALGGQLACLKYLHANGCPWDQRTCANAARRGNLTCLQYAHTNGCPWDKGTCRWAAAEGHLTCLEYAHTNGCPWDWCTCWKAAGGGHLACLEYAHTNGCPWDEDRCRKYAADWGHQSCVDRRERVVANEGR